MLRNFTQQPLHLVLAAAVAVAVALLGTFTHIVQQATVAGPARYSAKPIKTAKVASSFDRAAETR